MDKDSKKVGNLSIGDQSVIVSVNPKIYSIDVLYSAAYVFLEKAFVVIDGDPDKEVMVELRYKGKTGDLEELGRRFNNELINYAVYKTNSIQSQEIKSQIIAKALDTNSQETEDDYIEDPLGIAKPWEETHEKSED